MTITHISAKSKGSPFKVQTPANSNIIVTSPKHIRELAYGSPKQLSLHAVGKEVSSGFLVSFQVAKLSRCSSQNTRCRAMNGQSKGALMRSDSCVPYGPYSLQICLIYIPRCTEPLAWDCMTSFLDAEHRKVGKGERYRDAFLILISLRERFETASTLPCNKDSCHKGKLPRILWRGAV